MRVLCILTLVSLHSGISVESQRCVSPSNPNSLFGTKTLYRNVAGTLPPVSQQALRGCSPIFVNQIIRHGARYPGDDAVHELQPLKELARNINMTGKANLCKKDLQALRDWEIWTNEYNDKNLTSYGARELRELAQRFQQFLPPILGLQNSPTKYRFTSTDSQRTIDSMNAFVQSLFNYSASALEEAELEVVPGEVDPLNDEICDRYVREVDDNENNTAEYDKYLRGPHVARIARLVADRIGVPKSMISAQVLWTLYSEGCYSEQWVAAKTTPWCKIFSNRNLKLLEYASDVEDYPERGYKYPITYRQNCFLSKEIVNSIKTAADNDLHNVEQEYLGRFRFAHTSNIVTLAANMRLYEEEVGPSADDFSSQKRRSFQMSNMSPSAANLAFILYRCGNACHSRYKVQTYWNERLLTSFPACRSATRKNRGMCDLDKWLTFYQDFVAGSPTECDQEAICA